MISIGIWYGEKSFWNWDFDNLDQMFSYTFDAGGGGVDHGVRIHHGKYSYTMGWMGVGYVGPDRVDFWGTHLRYGAISVCKNFNQHINK